MKEILDKLNQAVDLLSDSEFVSQNGAEEAHIRNVVARINPPTETEREKAEREGRKLDNGTTGVYYFSEEIKFGNGLPSIKHVLKRDGQKETEGVIFLNGELQCSRPTRRTKKAREKMADELLGSFLKSKRRMRVNHEE